MPSLPRGQSGEPLMVSTGVAAQILGVGYGSFRQLAETRDDFPRPIPMISKHPDKRQLRWSTVALREWVAKQSAPNASASVTDGAPSAQPVAVDEPSAVAKVTNGRVARAPSKAAQKN